jgi:hypothetical protein
MDEESLRAFDHCWGFISGGTRHGGIALLVVIPWAGGEEKRNHGSSRAVHLRHTVYIAQGRSITVRNVYTVYLHWYGAYIQGTNTSLPDGRCSTYCTSGENDEQFAG